MKKYEEFVKIYMEKTEEMNKFHKKMKQDAIKAVSDRLNFLGVKELTLFSNDDVFDEKDWDCFYSEEDMKGLDKVVFYFGRSDNYYNIDYLGKDKKGIWVADEHDDKYYLNDPDWNVTDHDVLNLLEYLEKITPKMIEKNQIGEESKKFNL